jgi:hypothetical protein
LGISGATVSLFNVTLSENTVESETGQAVAGGLGVRDSGGAELNNVTVARNAAGSGTAANGEAGGIRNEVASALTLGNTIVAGNADSSGASPDCAGPITSAGYNILTDNSGCGFTPASGDQVGDVAGGGPALDPDNVLDTGAGDNGGGYFVSEAFVQQITVALVADSLALDAGDSNAPGSGGTCETMDQRGQARPQDADGDGSTVCDVGAVEGTETLPVVTFIDQAAPPTVGEQAGTMVLSDAVRLSMPYSETVTVDIVVDAAASEAAVPDDLDFTPATVTFVSGETRADLELTAVEDGVDEAYETLVLDLDSPTNASLGTPASLTVTVEDPSTDGNDAGDDGGGGGGLGMPALLGLLGTVFISLRHRWRVACKVR